MWPTNLGPPARDPASDGSDEKKSNRRLVRSDPLSAHPDGAFALSNPQGRPSYDVRAAIRRRSARRDLLIKLSAIAALLGAGLYVAYSYLL
jgi:hypothetical protein